MQTFDVKAAQVRHFSEAQKELICHAESQRNTSASQKGNGRFLEWVDKTDIGTSAQSNMTEITKRLPHFSFKYKGSIKITQSHFFFPPVKRKEMEE